MDPNLILATDSYKLGHHAMSPRDTSGEDYYLEARQGPTTDLYPEVLWVGLQPILQQIAETRVTEADIVEAEAFQDAHMPGTRFNRCGWQNVVRRHGGRLPVTIWSAPEGTVVPRGHVLLAVESTEEPWLPGHLETLLMHVWYPSTVATRMLHLRRHLTAAARRTGSPVEGVLYQVHDFGYRGVSSNESAAIGGAAHLMVFRGSDTIAGQRYLSTYYGAPLVSAGSVAASQHSIMTANGRHGEHALIDRLIASHPNQILSLVGDSYDYPAFVDAVIDRHEVAVRNRTRVVIRPDSVYDGKTPAEIVEWTLQRQRSRLSKYTKTTPTGHHITPFGVLWGDGIDDEGMKQIQSTTEAVGFASQNLVFGTGGWLLQKLNRDTLRFAMKLSARRVYSDETGWQHEWVGVQKDPLDHSKASKSGRLSLARMVDWYTVGNDPRVESDVWQRVFHHGVVLHQQTLDDIRERVDTAVIAQRTEEPESTSVT